MQQGFLAQFLKSSFHLTLCLYVNVLLTKQSNAVTNKEKTSTLNPRISAPLE